MVVVDTDADFVFVELAVYDFVFIGVAEFVVLSEYEEEKDRIGDWLTDTLPDSVWDIVICAVTDGEEVKLGDKDALPVTEGEVVSLKLLVAIEVAEDESVAVLRLE